MPSQHLGLSRGLKPDPVVERPSRLLDELTNKSTTKATLNLCLNRTSQARGITYVSASTRYSSLHLQCSKVTVVISTVVAASEGFSVLTSIMCRVTVVVPLEVATPEGVTVVVPLVVATPEGYNVLTPIVLQSHCCGSPSWWPLQRGVEY
ncbi:hypothetical protein PoB_006668500 [Plakobranchus ocellatus]|uniref:Uncharacterized protein n=1 Tax=Plakobranchus ocellatus TaxID=259542 RepID=A0AAV4D7S6_9GAST|nr:hypothetical protein PoB_006668500 [Plakobranchus ocellatus]